MGLGVAGEFQFGQCGQHGAVRSIDGADYFLDAHRRRTEGFADGAKQGWRHICIAGVEAIGEGLVEGWRGDAPHLMHNVLGGFDERGALCEEAVGAACARSKWRAWNSHDFAARDGGTGSC